MTNEKHTSLLSCRSVSRIYGDNYALVDVNTELCTGRVKALLGPNGAGKSTLLGLCSSRISASEGTVLFQGVSIEKSQAAFRRSLGIVSHQIMLYRELTGFENLEFFSSISGGPTQVKMIEAHLDRVGLTWAKDRRVDEYSRGMQQRLTVARALIHSPRLLLMDEPFTGLDQAGVALVTTLIDEAKARGAAVLVSSHDLSTLTELADDVLILKQGRVYFDGAAENDVSHQYNRVIGGGV